MDNKPLRSPTRSLWLLSGLAAALALASCAPAAATSVPTAGSPEVQAAATPTTAITLDAAQSTPTATIVIEVAQPTPTVTPRGSELVASDPSTVSLASGQLQLVEFFRFT